MARELIGGIEVFLTIIREGSLRAASRALGVGAPSISHQLSALERKLDVTLLVRTTRSIELTEAGRALLAGAGPAFAQIEDAVEGARAIGKSTTGTLRLSMPISAYRMVLSPVLPEFRSTYPNIHLDISLNEGLVDVIREGFHAGFRLGDRLTPEMIAVRLTAPLTPCFFAASSYLETAGYPTHPKDLLDHTCIRYKFITSNRVRDWEFMEDDQTKIIDAPVSMVFDNFEGIRQAVRDGLGIGWSLKAMVEEELKTGRLETVLETYVPPIPPYYLFYPEQNRQQEPLRFLIELLTAKRDSASRSAS